MYVYIYIHTICVYIYIYIQYIEPAPQKPSSPWCPQVLVNLVYQVEQIGTACNKVTLGAFWNSVGMVKGSTWLYY